MRQLLQMPEESEHGCSLMYTTMSFFAVILSCYSFATCDDEPLIVLKKNISTTKKAICSRSLEPMDTAIVGSTTV